MNDATNAVAPAASSLLVCRHGKQSVTCRACRQAKYRQGAAYKAWLEKQRERRRLRREEHFRRRNQFRHLTFDGRSSGPIPDWVPKTMPEKLPVI